MNIVIDYIIEQADRYDARNLQFEQDILFVLKREYDKVMARVLSCVTDINSIIAINHIVMKSTEYFTQYTNVVSNIIKDKFKEYYGIAYNQMGDLIQLGKEVQDKLQSNVSEAQYREYDEESIKFIRDHSLRLIKNQSNMKIDKLRGTLGDMFLRGNINKANVRKQVEKILDVDKSKAEEIAQTELSRAYNYGTMARLNEYQKLNPNENVRKYWHGFKYSEVTCTYCRPRIGNIYQLNDNTEVLPAHVRCRCVWLPVLGGWDKPVSNLLTTRANMLNLVYTKDQLYNRINNRLNINYGKYINDNDIASYMGGDRSPRVLSSISKARDNAISDTIDSFNIAIDTSNDRMSDSFNNQMKFWKDLTAGAIVDNDNDMLGRAKEALKGIMILPWNADQLSKWNDLLSKLNNR